MAKAATVTLPGDPKALQTYTDRIIEQVQAALGRLLDDKWDPADLQASYLADIIEPAVQAVSAGQASAASPATNYVSQMIKGFATPDPVGTVVGQAFAGFSSTGVPLSQTLATPIIEAKTRIKAGQTVGEAMAQAKQTLMGIVHTQVYDAQRAAVQTAMAAEPEAMGFVRQLRGASCNRCMILAGKVYRWSSGFQRHPRCDCVMVPISKHEYAQHRTTLADDPRKAFDAMSRQTQDKVFGKGDAEAIRNGADMSQVVNARRGMTVAQSGTYTTEGMARGWAKMAVKPGERRLMPADIMALAKSRDEALQLLRQYGYLMDAPAGPWVDVSHGAKIAERSLPKMGKTAVGHELVADVGVQRAGSWIENPWGTEAEGYLNHGLMEKIDATGSPAVRAKIEVMESVEARVPTDVRTTKDLVYSGLNDQITNTRVLVDGFYQTASNRATRQELADALLDPNAVWVRPKYVSTKGGTAPGWRLLQKADGTAMGTADEVLAYYESGQGYRLMPGTEYAHGGDPDLVRRVRQEAVSRHVARWAGTSGDTEPEALAMQLAAQDLFKMEGAWFPHETAYREAKQIYADEHWASGAKIFLRASYDQTQDWLASLGFAPDDEITLWRGTGVGHEPFTALAKTMQDPATGANARMWLTSESQVHTGVGLRTAPMSSWSVNPNVAANFASGKNRAVVLQSRVPIWAIIGTPRSGFGCLGESEFVVASAYGEATIVWAGRGFFTYELDLAEGM